MNSFYEKISLILKEIVKNDYGLALDGSVWESSTRQQFGDLSTSVSLKIASQLKTNPLDLAGEIKNKLDKAVGSEVEKIEVVRPGFVNVFFSQKLLIEFLSEIISKGRACFKKKSKKKVLIEFVSANPTGPLSIAHGRQAVVGDVLANIYQALGDQVEREYYLNDIGRQIDLLVLSVAERIKEIENKDYNLPEGGYRGEYVKEIASCYLRQADKEDLQSFCLDYIKSLIKDDLNKLDIFFDNWFSQKQLVEQEKVKEVIDILRKKKSSL